MITCLFCTSNTFILLFSVSVKLVTITSTLTTTSCDICFLFNSGADIFPVNCPSPPYSLQQQVWFVSCQLFKIALINCLEVVIVEFKNFPESEHVQITVLPLEIMNILREEFSILFTNNRCSVNSSKSQPEICIDFFRPNFLVQYPRFSVSWVFAVDRRRFSVLEGADSLTRCLFDFF